MIPIVLKVYEGGKLKGARSFRSERIRLGSAAADLTLEGPSVAPSHALIETGAQGAVLRALGTAPLYLNGQPIIAAPLRHGDLISIGELRIMVELKQAAAHEPRRPRLQLIQNDAAPPAEPMRPHTPELFVVREAQPPMVEEPLEADQGLHAEIAQPVQESAALALQEVPVPALRRLPRIPAAPGGGECVEVELFWGDTRVSVWQLQPGETFLAGSEPGCNALLAGVQRAQVVRSDAGGWSIAAPRPLQLFLEEEGRVLGGPELLVRGRSQADAHGLVVPLPQRAVAVLTSETLALRIRRVPGAMRIAPEPAEWKGVLIASVAAIFMMAGMKLWAAAVPPMRASVDPEFIRPRPMIVRAAAPQKPNDLQPQNHNQGRRDPGKAVARHQGLEGEAGSKTSPRRDARAQRKTDDRALVADTGLVKALGGGKGQSDLFGIALEKGSEDALGHLTGPRVADAHGDGGMGLKSLGGHGGGGDGSGLGLARIGTNGIGGGFANYGDGKGGLRGKENGEIGLGPERPEVVGSIDPELIRKVVHEHRAQIRTCYETQLTTKPDLAGKLVAAWTIDQSGAVTESHTQETNLHSSAVEQCVAARIKTWRFPIPKGGGEVFVTYPFIFTPGG